MWTKDFKALICIQLFNKVGDSITMVQSEKLAGLLSAQAIEPQLAPHPTIHTIVFEWGVRVFTIPGPRSNKQGQPPINTTLWGNPPQVCSVEISHPGGAGEHNTQLTAG